MSCLQRPMNARPGVAHLGLAAALLVAGCAHANSTKSLRLDSEIGAKDPTIGASMRNRPILDQLDEMDIPELWVQEESNFTAPPSPALEIGGEEKMEFEFRGTPLSEVLAFLGEVADVNIMFDPGLAQPVDASFPNVRVGEAIYAILEQNNLELVEDPPGLFSVRDLASGGGLMRSFQLSSIRASDAAVAAGEIVGDEAVVVTDEGQNLLFVRGSRAAVAAVADYLERADRLERQVLIEVQIIEAFIDESFDLGLSHAFNGRLDGNAFTIASNLSGTATQGFDAVFNFDGGDVRSTLDALQTYVDLELISSPRVMTVSGNLAKIEVIEEIPYIEATTSTATDAGQATTAVEQIAFKEAGVKLDVTPTIQANGVLKIQIAKELSEVVGQFQTIPIIDKRTLESQFLVANKQTIVLGGLMQDKRSDSESGVPILKDIPLLGRLFRQDSDGTEKRELLVFVTPRVVDPNEAAILAKRYQDHYERQRTNYGLQRQTR